MNPPPTEANGDNAYTLLGSVGNPGSLSLAPQGTPLWKTTWFNFAPRLGLAWSAHAQPGRETVFRLEGVHFMTASIKWGRLHTKALASQLTRHSLEHPSRTAQPNLPIPISIAPPYTTATVYAFPAHVQMPYTLQWNVSVQQAFGNAQTLTVLM